MLFIEQVCTILRESSNASCRLDPVPTWLLKSCLDVLVPPITEVVNLSLLSGHVPENWRTAVVIPLLTKPKLEKAALQQLLIYCEKNAPFPNI